MAYDNRQRSCLHRYQNDKPMSERAHCAIAMRFGTSCVVPHHIKYNKDKHKLEHLSVECIHSCDCSQGNYINYLLLHSAIQY